jgi:hypothetical protein
LIRVTIELVPYGDETQKETLETIHISNIGQSQHGYYNYTVERETKDMYRIAYIYSWDRSQEPLPLVETAIHKLLHSEEYPDQ